jgi:hypothetical protein
MSLKNLNPLTPADLPPENALDIEFQAADQAHVNAVDPHSQYLRKLNNFSFTVLPPIAFAANIWVPVGGDLQPGELGMVASWIVSLYWQLDASPFTNYGGAGVLGAIYWQADQLINEGILIPVEAHNEADFSCRVRFGRGNGLRKLEIKPDRNINISSPGFFRVSGVRIL